MSRRRRAAVFLLLALGAAGLGAILVEGYGSNVARGYGPLRPVVVLSAGVHGGKPLAPREIARALEVRRIPARFVPPGALVAPEEALGLVPRLSLVRGSYLLATELRPPGRHRAGRPGLGRGRRPVEISVSGADALRAARSGPARGKVDIVITTEPRGPGPGRTYVAAARVPLLALRPEADGPGAGGLAAATLGLTRAQALRLIAAESFARKLTLLPVG